MYVLEVNRTGFMSHDIHEFLLASNNKAALLKLGKLFQAIDPEISYCVLETKTNKAYRTQRVDMNYTFLLDAFKQPEAKILNDEDYNVSEINIEFYSNITKALMHKCLLLVSSRPEEQIEGHKRKVRAMRNGKCFCSPDKYDYYKRLYIAGT